MVSLHPRYTMLVLCLLFVAYSFHIYTKEECAITTVDSGKAAAGRLIWQEYNCQACHQLFGLGGFLGPDLSNVYSREGKGPVYIAAMLKAGTVQMPSYTLSKEETELLIAFLKAVDACGNANPGSFEVGVDGMISQTEH